MQYIHSLMRLLHGQTQQRGFKSFSSHYAYTAAYFPFANYIFGDTHNGEEHQQVLLEMLNICEKLI